MSDKIVSNETIEFFNNLTHKQDRLFKEFEKITGKKPKETFLYDTGNWCVLFGDSKDDKLTVYELYIEHYKCSTNLNVGFSNNLSGWYISSNG